MSKLDSFQFSGTLSEFRLLRRAIFFVGVAGVAFGFGFDIIVQSLVLHRLRVHHSLLVCNKDTSSTFVMWLILIKC